MAFEAGMFAWTAFSSQVLLHPQAEPTQPVYWFSIQIAMLIGFLGIFCKTGGCCAPA